MKNQYTEKCCRLAWEQICLPMIDHHKDWSTEEDQLLEKLVQIHGAHADQWPIIAANFVSLREDLKIFFFSSLLVASFSIYVRESLCDFRK